MIDLSLCLRISAFSAVGYYVAIAGPMFLDPKLITHVKYKARAFEGRKWLWLASGSVFFLLPLLPLLPALHSQVALFTCSLAPMIFLGVVLSWLFPPEKPHMGIVVSATGFLLVILLTLIARSSGDNFDSISDVTIPLASRIEYVKAVVTFWQMIAVYSGVGYLAFAVSWLYAMWFTTEKMATSKADKFSLGQ